MVNLLFAPQQRAATLLEVTFSYEGPGKMISQYKLTSFSQMDEDTQNRWKIWYWLVIICSIVDLLLLVWGVIGILRERAAWVRNIKRDGSIPASGRVHSKIKAAVRKHLPLWGTWDVVDLGLRVYILVFTMEHYQHYNSPDLASTGRGNFEDLIQKILVLPWQAEQVTYNEKVRQFFNIVSEITDFLDRDQNLRVTAYILILVSFFRVVAYLRVHPRIAVLYKTVEVAVDDLVHFFAVFGLLYMVLAFIAMWMFGADNPKYGSLGQAVLTQYEMLLGDMPWPESEQVQNFMLFMTYLVLYGLIVVFILLNFLLAIIVDSYATVKEQVSMRFSSYHPVVRVYNPSLLSCL